MVCKNIMYSNSIYLYRVGIILRHHCNWVRLHGIMKIQKYIILYKNRK